MSSRRRGTTHCKTIIMNKELCILNKKKKILFFFLMEYLTKLKTFDKIFYLKKILTKFAI